MKTCCEVMSDLLRRSGRAGFSCRAILLDNGSRIVEIVATLVPPDAEYSTTASGGGKNAQPRPRYSTTIAFCPACGARMSDMIRSDSAGFDKICERTGPLG
jgi:hypothetical protein